MFVLGFFFGGIKSSDPVPIIQSPVKIETQLKHSSLSKPYQASKSSSVSKIIEISGGALGKHSNPGNRARMATANKAKTRSLRKMGNAKAKALRDAGLGVT